MLTRRELLGGSLLVGLGNTLVQAPGAGSPAHVAPAAAGSDAAPAPQPPGLCDYVDPFIGTGGHGHTFPGATVPFGMVQLSPDTAVAGWDASSGYHYSH